MVITHISSVTMAPCAKRHRETEDLANMSRPAGPTALQKNTGGWKNESDDKEKGADARDAPSVHNYVSISRQRFEQGRLLLAAQGPEHEQVLESEMDGGRSRDRAKHRSRRRKARAPSGRQSKSVNPLT